MTPKEKGLLNRRISGMAPFIEILSNFSKFHRASEDIVIFEIGVRRGVSTRALLRGLTERFYGGHLYSVDIKEGYSKMVTDEKQKQLWTFICGDSRTIDWDKEIDILFIDGDHQYKVVKADYEKYEPLVKKGGYIIMHDVLIHARHFGVDKLWEEIKYPKIRYNFNVCGLGVIEKI